MWHKCVANCLWSRNVFMTFVWTLLILTAQRIFAACADLDAPPPYDFCVQPSQLPAYNSYTSATQKTSSFVAEHGYCAV